MNTHSDTHSEDLIDLGAVSAETKGIGQAAQDSDVSQLQFPTAGLCAD